MKARSDDGLPDHDGLGGYLGLDPVAQHRATAGWRSSNRRTAADERLREVADGPRADKGKERHADNRRHEVARHLIGEPLHLRRTGLCLFDDPDDLGQRRILAHVRGAEAQHAAAIEGRSDHL